MSDEDQRYAIWSKGYDAAMEAVHRLARCLGNNWYDSKPRTRPCARSWRRWRTMVGGGLTTGEILIVAFIATESHPVVL